MKKVLKIVAIVVVVLIVLGAGVLFIGKRLIVSKFIPENLILSAPDRIMENVQIDDSDILQKHVTGGIIRGIKTETVGVQVYKRIPYAAPPVNGLRWKRAQDVIPWDGVWDCSVCGPNPVQGDNEIKPGEDGAETVPDPTAGYSEDCLYLNVWTNDTGAENMPVVFYIPGGAWVGGSNSVENYNGEYLASQDVVFVSINYRLGIFGWLGADVLSEEDPEGSTGNYGLTDIIKALEWTRENIEVFGGDPHNITLYGGSAGGNLIDMLIVSPKAEGLFQKAVSMSYPLDIISPAWDKSVKTELGNKLIPDEPALSKLRRSSVKDIMSDMSAVAAYAFSGPTLDGVYLDMLYKDAVASGRGKDIAYIMGVNYNDDYPEYEGSPTGDASFVSMIGEKPDSCSNGDVLRTIMDMTARARCEGGASETYIFQFSHLSANKDRPLQGAVHGGDLPYMIQYFSANNAYWTDADREMGNIASTYFINFCRTGDPNGNGLTEWGKANGNGSYLLMDNHPEMRLIEKETVAEEFVSVNTKN